MAEAGLTSWLDRQVDEANDHVLGPTTAEITLVEYGSYACPFCRAANEEIAKVRNRFGDRLRYVFRHRPLTDSDIARRAAVLAEHASDPGQFWRVHLELMTRSPELTEDDLVTVANELGLTQGNAGEAEAKLLRARERVETDEQSARASGVMITPTFFINGRRYDGPWDQHALSDALLGTLGHRVRVAALEFVSWGPSAGILLLLATLLAVAWTNPLMNDTYESVWERSLGILFGDIAFTMSLRHWVNDGLLTLFFLVIGLEIKRELTVGHLATVRSAALPMAAAVGGMVAPASVYMLIIPTGLWAQGWGVPLSTDTAFAIALIAMMGRRVPVELRIFLTATAIVDDIGAIIVVAIFYSGSLHVGGLAAAAALTGVLALLNRSRVYRVTPYLLLGAVLWGCVLVSGLHPTLAGILLALFIPTRPPPNLKALAAHADTIIASEAAEAGEVLRHGPSLPALNALDAIHDRIESPADRLLRHAGARSSYAVLPIFALANAGVTARSEMFVGYGWLIIAIVLGLAVGKPLGLVIASAAAVHLKAAVKPDAYSWRQLAGAGALAGIGFTMSLFIAGQAFPNEHDFAAAKIAVFAGSIISAVIGVALLWTAHRPNVDGG